jgi:hypothetical protein
VCIKATAAVGDVSIPRRPKKSSTGVITVARRSSHRSVSSSSSSPIGIESLETRSLMSATLPLEIGDAGAGPLNPAAYQIVSAGPGGGPHVGDTNTTKGVLVALLLPAKAGPGGGPHIDDLIIPGPHIQADLHPGGVNVDQGTVFTITFGGTLLKA